MRRGAQRSEFLSVFLSSTSLDLREHREAIRQKCAALGYRVVAMEEFGAQDGNAAGISLKEIAPCDVFVGVYARRYGYVPKQAETSVTEMEYDEAKRLGKPRLVFVVAPDYREHPLLQQQRDDDDAAQGLRLRAFVSRLGEERVHDTFTDPTHLAERVRFALSKWEGWRCPVPPEPPARAYVGRDELLTKLRDHVQQQERQMALLGIGGIGKTLTAAHLARSMSERFDGGVFWTTLGPEATDTDRLQSETMRVWMQCHHPGRVTPVDLLEPATVRNWQAEAPGKLLFVLDDIWHAQPARALLGLIPTDATVLLLSRRVDVARQLDISRTFEIARFSDEDARAMLRDRVGDVPSRTALRGIVTALEGHPLALEIVAAQIRQNGPDFAEELPDRLRRNVETGTELSALAMEGEGREASVEAALALTYSIMNQDLKRRFRALGVLARGAPITPLIMGGVWGVAAGDPERFEDAADRIGALVSSGVLSREPGQRVFYVHGLLRSYAKGLLAVADEAERAEDKYRKTIVVVAENGFAKPPDTWREMETYVPHVDYVGDQITRDAEALWGPLQKLGAAEPSQPGIPNEAARTVALQGVNFAAAVTPYIVHRRQFSNAGARWLALGLASARALKEQGLVLRFTTDLALGEIRAGRPQAALDYLDNAMKVEVDHADSRADVLERTGHALTTIGDYERAVAAYENALQLFRDRGERTGEAAVHVGIGSVYSRRGDFATALNHFEQARKVFTELNNLPLLASTLNHIGGASCAKGDWAKAAEAYSEALNLARQNGNRAEEAVTLNNQAGIFWGTRRFAEAIALYERALEIRREIGDRPGEAKTLVNLGTAYEGIGRGTDAMRVYEPALALSREMGDRATEAACLSNIANNRLCAGQHADALPLLEQALGTNRQLGDRFGEGKVLNLLGDVFYALRQAEPTKKSYEQALTIMREVGDRPGEAQALQNLGIFYHAANDIEQSLRFYEQSLSAMREIGNRMGEAVTLGNMASVWYAAGKPRRALETLDQALQLARLLGDPQVEVAFEKDIEEIRSMLAQGGGEAEQPAVSPAMSYDPIVVATVTKFLEASKVVQAMMCGK